MTLKFLRNKVVEVAPRPEGDLEVSWRLTDDLHRIEVHVLEGLGHPVNSLLVVCGMFLKLSLSHS